MGGSIGPAVSFYNTMSKHSKSSHKQAVAALKSHGKGGKTVTHPTVAASAKPKKSNSEIDPLRGLKNALKAQQVQALAQKLVGA